MPTLAAVFAHPDDETFAVGGTLARLSAGGVHCALYCATDGDAGRASGLEVDSRQALGRVRRAELELACHMLGISALRCGGYPDGALGAVDQEALIGDIVDFLREHRPEVVVTFGPEGAPTGHRDHKAISRAATAAFFLAGLPTAYPEQLGRGRAAYRARRLYYVSWTPPVPDGMPHPYGLQSIDVRIPIADLHDVKRRAFHAHRSQRDHEARFVEMGLTPDEAYLLASGEPQSREVVADLFDGL